MLLPLAEKGNCKAQYSNGGGVEQNYAKALEWYEKAAELGNSAAMMGLRNIYENGLGVEQDSEKAKEWFDKAMKAMFK